MKNNSGEVGRTESERTTRRMDSRRRRLLKGIATGSTVIGGGLAGSFMTDRTAAATDDIANPDSHFDVMGSSDGLYEDPSRRNAAVYLFPNEKSTRTEYILDPSTLEAGPVLTAVRNALQSLLDYGAIDHWEVHAWVGPDDADTGGMGLDDSDKSTFNQQFNDFLTDEISGDEHSQNYLTNNRGALLGIADGFDGGGGCGSPLDFYCDAPENSSFCRGVPPIMGTASGNDSKIKTLAIQETLHMFISYDHIESLMMDGENLVESGGRHHEHDLGTIYSDGSVSPLAITHEHEGHPHHGKCAAPTDREFGGTYSQTLTSCTKYAVKETASYAANNC